MFVSRDSALEGECEREMELELEEEEEVERQVAKMQPYEEIDWDYTAALTMHSLSEVSSSGIPKVRIGNFHRSAKTRTLEVTS